jgi:CspA family cold shock protein
MIATGRVSWFNLQKKIGLVKVDNGESDAFLHVSVLKAAGYVSVPAGTTLRVKIELDGNRPRVAEVLSVDTSTANPGEPGPVRRKKNPTEAPPDSAKARTRASLRLDGSTPTTTASMKSE